jgi:signal transduction histidine kinase
METDSLALTDARPRRGLPLERKLPLVVLALFTIVLAISLAISYFEVRSSAIATTAERLIGLGQTLGTTLEQSTQARLALMRRVARDPAIVAALQSPDQEPSAAASRAWGPLVATASDSATPPEIWNTLGQPIGQRRLEPAAEQQVLRDEVLQHFTARDSGFVSNYRITNGRASLYEAVPIRGGNGAPVGFLVQERRINTNPRTLPLLRGLIGSDIEFHFRNANDNTWIQLSGSGELAPTASERTLDSLEILTRQKTGRALSYTVPIRNTPLLLTVERPMSAILERALQTIRILIVISVLLAVAGAMLVWLFSRRLVRPLGDLTVAAEQMAHGQYSQRVRVTSGDEVGRLASAFNRMAEEVKDSSDTSSLALERLTKAMETQEFLAEASRILAGSVSDDTLLPELARYCVPRLADYCSIHVVDDDGTISRIETAHRDPSMEPKVRQLQSYYTYRVDGPGEVPEVIRSQRPLVIPEIDLEAISARASGEFVATLLRAIMPSSFLCVPLVVRGRGFGAMSFTMTDSGRRFGDEDLELAMELARRAAVAIDNAVIYRRSVALRLEAEAASNAKSDFLAKMSHEIRTPINAMMGYAELLQMGMSGPVNDAQEKQLGRIRASGDHLASLINEILDLSKIEAGRMSVRSVDAKAVDAVEGALTVVRPLAGHKGVNLPPHIDGDADVEYHGDPQRVQQILTNLLSNAVKFTPAGGRLTVRCDTGHLPTASAENGNRWACISVCDTGVGISAEDIDRIFHPFVQVDTGYTRTQGGTGLGLTISRNLAQLMGGDITVESRLGKGSTFALWLPCPIRALPNN